MSSFVLPEREENSLGWGPASVRIDPAGLPAHPFNKGERLGKISDFAYTGQRGNYGTGDRRRDYNAGGAQQRDGRRQDQVAQEGGPGAPGGSSGTAFFQAKSKDEHFNTVEMKAQAPRGRGGGRGGPWRGNRGGRGFFRGGRGGRQYDMRVDPREDPNSFQNVNRGARGGRGGRGGRGRGGFRGAFRGASDAHARGSKLVSVEARSDWEVLEQFTFTNLLKLNAAPPAEPETLVEVGCLKFFNRSFDGLRAKRVGLTRFESYVERVSTSEDPVIRDLAAKGEGNVFATDALVALLMAFPRSLNSWDIVVNHEGDALFMDARNYDEFMCPSVNETAVAPPEDEAKDPFNSAKALSYEAGVIEKNYQQMVVRGSEKVLSFDGTVGAGEIQGAAEEEEESHPVLYRYRRWKLSESITLVLRCEVSCALDTPDGPELCVVHALNEYTAKPGEEWRRVLENRPGAVLINEIKNNACKLARWTVESILAGAKTLKLGYVSRSNFRDPNTHAVLGSQSFQPADLANQISIKWNNMWGILRDMIHFVQRQDPGKYILQKEPQKPAVRLFSVPENAFDGSSSESEGEDHM